MNRKGTCIVVSVLVLLGLLMGTFGCSQPAPTPTPAPDANPRVSPDGTYTVGDGLWFLLTNHNLGNIRWDRSGWDHGVIEKVETDTGYIMWAFKDNGWQQYVYHIPTNTMRRRSGNHLVTL